MERDLVTVERFYTQHSGGLQLKLVAGAKGLASLCGATIGLISGNTEMYTQWVTIAAAWSWFPLLVAGMIRMVRAPLSLVSISLVAIAAGMMCTASPSQPVIQSSFFAAVFSVAALIWRWREDGGASAGQLLAGLVVSGVIAVALAAVAFVPMTLVTGEMIRAVGNQSIIGHASIPWKSFKLSTGSVESPRSMPASWYFSRGRPARMRDRHLQRRLKVESERGSHGCLPVRS